MIEQRINVGDYCYGFDFPSEVSGGGPGMSNMGVIDDASLTIRRVTKRRHGFAWSQSSTTITQDEIRFKWLPWVDGKINYCSAQGSDVLSGWFSGCWMASYMEGDARVCHIALQRNDHDCEAAWRAKKSEAGVSNIREFRPHTSVSRGGLKLGLVTSTGALYAIGLAATKLDIENPWRTRQEWKDLMPVLTDVQADELAAKEFVPCSNVHPAGAWQVIKIAGPLRIQTFPAV